MSSNTFSYIIAFFIVLPFPGDSHTHSLVHIVISTFCFPFHHHHHYSLTPPRHIISCSCVILSVVTKKTKSWHFLVPLSVSAKSLHNTTLLFSHRLQEQLTFILVSTLTQIYVYQHHFLATCFSERNGNECHRHQHWYWILLLTPRLWTAEGATLNQLVTSG